MTFAVNHLAPFLLTHLLLDMLKGSAPSRVVNVTSDAHFGVSIHFEELKGKEGPGGYRAYRQSKLANILFTYELAERLKGSGVTANCLSPGAVRTELAREYWILGFIWRWFPLFRSASKGAETPAYLATSSEVNPTQFLNP